MRFTAPSAGTVLDIKRGEKRAFQALIIAVEDGGETDDQVQFQAYSGANIADLSTEPIKALLLESGLWTALRTRPFSRIPGPETTPHSIFVTAVDTNPHAPNVAVALKGREADFKRGLVALGKLARTVRVQVEQAPARHRRRRQRPGRGLRGCAPRRQRRHSHPHARARRPRPRGLARIGYRNVAAIGVLFATGKLDNRRVIALAGPQVKRPRLLQTVVGASLDKLSADELGPGENRVISGSVLSGRKASGNVKGYLGRYHLQVSALLEGRHRELLGWLAPGAGKFADHPGVLRLPGPPVRQEVQHDDDDQRLPAGHGPDGMYERVMPLDMPPDLPPALVARRRHQPCGQLGALELDEEDLALCTFVDPGKADFGVVLRKPRRSRKRADTHAVPAKPARQGRSRSTRAASSTTIPSTRRPTPSCTRPRT